MNGGVVVACYRRSASATLAGARNRSGAVDQWGCWGVQIGDGGISIAQVERSNLSSVFRMDRRR
jgi:hypothetical protein